MVGWYNVWHDQMMECCHVWNFSIIGVIIHEMTGWWVRPCLGWLDDVLPGNCALCRCVLWGGQDLTFTRVQHFPASQFWPVMWNRGLSVTWSVDFTRPITLSFGRGCCWTALIQQLCLSLIHDFKCNAWTKSVECKYWISIHVYELTYHHSMYSIH